MAANQDGNLPLEIYARSLKKIGNVSFTPREIDIISFIVSGRSAKKAASFLSLSPKTIESYTRNIMIKLECNSRESIIDFVEQSPQFPDIKRYYESLLVQGYFESQLKQISSLLKKEENQSLTLYHQEGAYLSFVERLAKHLAIAGLKVSCKVIIDFPSFIQLLHKDSDINFNIYCLPNPLSRELESLVSPNSSPINKKSNHNLLLFLEDEASEEASPFLNNFPYINLNKQPNYYDAVFAILEKLAPNLDLEKFHFLFQNRYGALQQSSLTTSDQASSKIKPVQISHTVLEEVVLRLNTKKRMLLLKVENFLISRRGFISIFSFFLTLGFFYLEFSNFQKHRLEKGASQLQESEQKKQVNLPVRSDMVIPAGPVLLNRANIINEIDNQLRKQKDGIQIVALVGVGGSGKTTLARQYAQLQNLAVVWEINAETKESLKASFEKLVHHLAHTEEDKKILREIQDIKNPIEKEEKILLFVQKNFRLQSNWLLIYDNVEKFIDIKKHFPHDINIWGEGKIILTTQNTNIQNTSLVNNIIYIGELSLQQKLDLFTTIMSHGSSDLKMTTKSTVIIEFLKNIPPFPLDVSVAAYYLKSTSIPYEKYLYNLENYNKEFVELEENLLIEAGTYFKTRYHLIKISLDHLLESHKDFADLLILISLLDSQNIPCELLKSYKSQEVVDNFIYHLKKYSLIINDFSKSHSDQLFSIHRSTQNIMLRYLERTLNIKKYTSHQQEIGNILEKYISYVINKDDLFKMRLIENHCENFLNNQNLKLSDLLRGAIEGRLAHIYFYQGKYIKAKNILNKSIARLDNSNNKKSIIMARNLTSMGIIEREIGKYEEARKVLEQSLTIYQAYSGDNHVDVAYALSNLGNVYRSLGNYRQAQTKLERALSIYQNTLPTNYGRKAWILAHLANVYRELGDYKKSKDLFEESLLIYQKHLPHNYGEIAWTLTYLGNIYRDVGDYKKAKEIYEQGLKVYTNHFSKSHIRVIEAQVQLGCVYRKLGMFDKAQELLEHSLRGYKMHFTSNHVDVAWTLTHLACIYIDVGAYKKAEELLEESLTIYKKNFSEDNCEIAWVLRILGNTKLHLGNIKNAKKFIERSIDICKHNMPTNDIRIAAVMGSLGNVYGKLGYYKKAKYLIENNLSFSKKKYGNEHPEIAKILIDLGMVYLSEGCLESAEELLNRSSRMFDKNKDFERYISLESLAEVYLKKIMYTTTTDSNKTRDYRNKALKYLQQAQFIVKAYFPKNSPHIKRIQEKILKLTTKVDSVLESGSRVGLNKLDITVRGVVDSSKNHLSQKASCFKKSVISCS